MFALTVFGVTGRMGQSVLRALREAQEPPRWRLAGAVASAQSPGLGADAAAEGLPFGVAVSADAEAAVRDASVAVDFSRPESVARQARAWGAAGVPRLVATTGCDDAARGELLRAAERIAVLIAPNTGVGVNVMLRLTAIAAAALGRGADVEISEAHHRMKRDAPSGTALALGEAVAGARGANLADLAVFERHGSGGPRTEGSIGFSALRAGDIVGEHTVLFGLDGERLEITHRATDRMVFARGALRAAAWLTDRPPGLYGMRDVLEP